MALKGMAKCAKQCKGKRGKTYYKCVASCKKGLKKAGSGKRGRKRGSKRGGKRRRGARKAYVTKRHCYVKVC